MGKPRGCAMVEFEVKRNSTYMELKIKGDNLDYSSGLLDEKESVDLARELIYAAEQLLPDHVERYQPSRRGVI